MGHVANSSFKRSTVIKILSAGLSGGMLWASFPSLSISYLAWIALVPLLVAMETSSFMGSGAISYVAGWIMFAGIFYWIPMVPAISWSGYLLLVTYGALYVGSFGMSLWIIRRRTGAPLSLLAPPLWLAVEYARSHAGFLGAPWMLLGHSQFEHPILLQISAVTGAYGVSFVVVLVNAAVADWIISYPSFRWSQRPSLSAIAGQAVHCRSRIALAFGGGVLAACALFGYVRMDADHVAQFLRVSIVQGNIPQDRKWEPEWRDRIFDRHVALTRQAAVHSPQLIVWPETSVPGDVVHSPPLRERMAGLSRETGSYLLAGSASNAKFSDQTLAGKKFNSMVLFSPEGTLAGEYRKVILVPFVEYAPIRLAALWSKSKRARQDMVAGQEATLLSVGSLTIGTLICWENIFPDLFRQMAGQGAHLMVNATNEAWFGESSASEQFLAMSVFRAVENHVAIARAANTGISSFIDPYGRITARLAAADGKELFVEGTLTQDVPLSTQRTFYTSHGDVFAMTGLVVCAFFVLWAGLAGSRLRSFPQVVVPVQGEQL